MGQSVEKLDFPTVVAKRGGKIVGFLSTLPRKDAIVAGPLVVNLLVAGPTVMRLAEAYEHILLMAKVTEYLFFVADSRWVGIIRRALDIEPMEAEGGWWFRRKLPHGRISPPSAGTVSH